jgi:Mitochondrial carrier protein
LSQGVFMTPTQRLKTLVMTDPRFAAESGSKGVMETFGAATRVLGVSVREDGVSTLFRGLGPMVMKRGLDWGLRFTGVSIARSQFERWNGDGVALSVPQQLASGFFGGAFSTMTMPLDSLVANTQKARGEGPKLSTFGVAKDMWAQGGMRPFVRGWQMRVMHAGYHTMWMATIGNYVFEAWERAKKARLS